jgi:hypothetical protein
MTAVETTNPSTTSAAGPAGGQSDDERRARIEAFAAETVRVARDGFARLWATGVLAPSATIQINERVPGEDKLVGVVHPNPWRTRTPQVTSAVFGFDATPYLGDPGAARGARRFAAIFEQHPDVTTVVHVHSPYLGAWAQVHRALPVTSGELADALGDTAGLDELPVYIDRRQTEVDFILEQIARDPRITAIVEANGGGTVWGRTGLAAAVGFIEVLERAARSTALAQSHRGEPRAAAPAAPAAP